MNRETRQLCNEGVCNLFTSVLSHEMEILGYKQDNCIKTYLEEMCCISGKFYCSKQDPVKDFCKGHELNKIEFMNKLISSVVLLS